jgi:hypothetical protein
MEARVPMKVGVLTTQLPKMVVLIVLWMDRVPCEHPTLWWIFFKGCEKITKGLEPKKKRNLQEFQHKPNESLWEACAQMKRLITITQGVIET